MSTDILETIAAATRERVAAAQAELPLEELEEACWFDQRSNGDAFEAALKKPGMSFICEVKRASPSKGLIAEDFPYLDIAHSYEEAGASAISCLTEPQWFKGSTQIFEEIRGSVRTPMLRKDFTVDPYMIYEARAMGADAVLLICSLLGQKTLAEYLKLARKLGLAALVEAHDEDEVRMAVDAGARIIGVNNRNLRDFSVDFENSIRLRELVPERIAFVAESGVKTPEDIKLLHDNGVDAVLIGETLMRAADKRAMLDELRSLL